MLLRTSVTPGKAMIVSSSKRHVAGPGGDHHAGAVVGREPLVGGQQLGAGRPVDGVPALRPVDGDDGGRADALVGDRHAIVAAAASGRPCVTADSTSHRPARSASSRPATLNRSLTAVRTSATSCA
jgi:hypothetical protein